MYHEIIPSFINIPLKFHKQAVLVSNDNDILCEVNCSFFGKTACYALELVHLNQKKCKFYCFDLFNCIAHPIDGEPIREKTPWAEDTSEWLNRVGGNHKLLDAFDFYLENFPHNKLLTSRAQFPSWQAAHEFLDNSVFYTFIRCSESYQHTRNDLIDWFKKIKIGGSMVLFNANSEATRAIHDVSKEFNINSSFEENCFVFNK